VLQIVTMNMHTHAGAYAKIGITPSNSLQVTTMFPLIPWRVRGAKISSALDLQPYLWPLNTISVVASCRLIITGPLLMRDATPEQTKTLLLFQVDYERLFQLLHVSPDHSGFLFFDEGQQLFEMLDAYKKGNGDRVRTLQLKGGNKWTRELVNDVSLDSSPDRWVHPARASGAGDQEDAKRRAPELVANRLPASYVPHSRYVHECKLFLITVQKHGHLTSPS
jgi:hypothetical protein